MSDAPDLSPGNLFSRAVALVKEHPGLIIGMSAVFLLVTNGQSATVGVADEGVRAGANLVNLILGGPLLLGLDWAILRLVRGDKTVGFGALFDGFGKFLTGLGLYLMFMLTIIVGSILLVVPGVIAAIGLWPAFFIVMDKDKGAVEAYKAAWALTDGHKGSIFVLGLAFFALNFVGVLACGVGVFISMAITNVMIAMAYDELSKAGAEQEG